MNRFDPFAWFMLAATCCAATQPLAAQSAGARFLLWQPSARSQALGGAGVALTQEAFSAMWLWDSHSMF